MTLKALLTIWNRFLQWSSKLFSEEGRNKKGPTEDDKDNDGPPDDMYPLW